MAERGAPKQEALSPSLSPPWGMSERDDVGPGVGIRTTYFMWVRPGYVLGSRRGILLFMDLRAL